MNVVQGHVTRVGPATGPSRLHAGLTGLRKGGQEMARGEGGR